VRRTGALSAALVLLVAVVSGCGPNNSPAESRKALPDRFPAIVNNWKNRVERVEFQQDFSLDDYRELVFLPLDTSQAPLPPNDNTLEPAKQALARSTTVISHAVERRLTSIPVTVATSAGHPAGNVIVLRGAITEMNPGSRAARYWVSFGAGSAGTRISGELVDGPSGRTLLRFKHVRVSGGGSFGGDYDQLLDANMKGIGDDIGFLVSGFSPRAAAQKK
jgi:hypothetical protein